MTSTLSDVQGRGTGWFGWIALSLCVLLAASWMALRGRHDGPPVRPAERGVARTGAPPRSAQSTVRDPPPPAIAPPAAGTVSPAVEDSASQEPPPVAGEEVPRPLQREPSAEEARQMQRSALDLLDRSLARLEAERARAGQAQSPEEARRDEVRIARLRQRRAALRAQLEAP